MTQLTLIIEKSPDPQLSGRTVCFGQDGGTLGRSSDATLVLADPERVISSSHARIECSGGAFTLVDTSTNGTYHNSPQKLIGKNRSVSLDDGDRLFIGDFVLRVDLEEAFASQPERGAAADPPAQTGAPSTAGDDWDLGEFSLAWGEDDPGPAKSSPSGSRPEDDEPDQSYSNSPEREFFAPPSPKSQGSGGEAIPDDWDDFLTGFHGGGPGQAAPKGAGASPAEPAPEGSQGEPEAPDIDGFDVLDELIDQPGQIEPKPEPDWAQAAAPAEPVAPPASPMASPPMPPPSPAPRPVTPPVAPPVGSMPSDETHAILLTVTQGLMALLQGRSEIKNEFRIAQTRIGQSENNPLKFSPDPAEALRRVLGNTESGGFLTGARAFEDALQDIQAHQLAILSAVQRAIESSISQFDPAALEKKLQRISPISAKTPGLKAAKCWNLFTVHYEEVAGRMRDDARKLFLTEFAEAYEEASNELARAKKQT